MQRGKQIAAARRLAAFPVRAPGALPAPVRGALLATVRGALLAPVLGALFAPALVRAEETSESPTWITSRDGTPFRVRFDPGHRLLLGVLADLRARDGATLTPGIELGLLLRSATPAGDLEVFWKRQHEIAHLAFRPVRGGAPAIDGRLYRGTFMRRARNGSLTIPTTPPVRFPVPFDIGALIELGRIDGVAWPEPGGPGLVAGVVRGDVLADFWRSPRPGRWLAVGVGARYDVGLDRDPTGMLQQDHRITPMTALTVAARTESAGGLGTGFLDAAVAYRWSSVRGWEQSLRADAEVEIIPLAINDRPVSWFARAGVELGGGGPRPDLRALIGIRFAAPLR